MVFQPGFEGIPYDFSPIFYDRVRGHWHKNWKTPGCKREYSIIHLIDRLAIEKREANGK